MAGDRRFLVHLGAHGMLNLLYPEGSWWRETMNGHLAGRAFYDETIDPVADLRDYALHYHGPEAGPLMEAYYLAWADAPKLAMKSGGVASLGDLAILREQRRRFLEPAKAASENDPVLRHRMQKVETLHRLAEMMMEVEISKREAASLLARGDRAAARRRLEGGLETADRLEAFAKRSVSPTTGVVDPGFVRGPLRRKRSSVAKALERLGPDAEPGASAGEEGPGRRISHR
jgi:hypothetical protein